MSNNPTIATPSLANLPVELFYEIFSHFRTLTTEYYLLPGYSNLPPPNLEYAERLLTLRAVSQTCRALRSLTLPLLWSSIETIWVPKELPKLGVPFPTYQMIQLRRTASIVISSGHELRSCVRSVWTHFLIICLYGLTLIDIHYIERSYYRCLSVMVKQSPYKWL